MFAADSLSSSFACARDGGHIRDGEESEEGWQIRNTLSLPFNIIYIDFLTHEYTTVADGLKVRILGLSCVKSEKSRFIA